MIGGREIVGAVADRRQTARRLALVGPGLAATAAAGFLLGACGGGDGAALTTRTGVTATRPTVTDTRPGVTAPTPTRTAPTVPTRTDTSPVTTAESPDETTTLETTTLETTTIETTTIETTTIEPQPPTPTPPPTVTVIETQTTAPAPTLPATTTTAAPAESTSSESSAPWGWIALSVGLAAASVIGIVLWRRSRAEAASWSTRLAELSRRCLVALDDVLREGSVVTGQVQALAAEARSLESHAPDDPARSAAARLRARLDDLAATLESDRALRLGSPPPTGEQVAYSTALIREQVEQLQRLLRPRSPGPSAA
jgi:hypothetical protein